MADDAATEQAEELLVLKSIFGEDCEVDTEEYGSVSFALRIRVDVRGATDTGVRVLAEIPQDAGSSTGSEVPAVPVARSDAQEVEQLSAGNEEWSALQVAKSLIQRAAPAPKNTLQRTETGSHVTYPGMTIKHLPPLTLQVHLPAEYPAAVPPEFHLSCAWLTSGQLETLCNVLDETAEELHGSPVVFTWAEVLRGETFDILGLCGVVSLRMWTGCGDPRAIAECVDPCSSIVQLMEYNQERELELWRLEDHLCQICFASKPGAQFVVMGACSHSFCKECVSHMAHLHVREGSILELRCPDPKCRAEMTPSALEEVLDDEAFERWYQFKLEQVMAAQLEGVVFCPRCEEHGRETPVICQKPTERGEAPLARCPTCTFVFCGICLALYHNNVEDCISVERRLAQKALRSSTVEHRKQLQANSSYTVFIDFGDTPPKFDLAGYCSFAVEDLNISEGDQLFTITSNKNKSALWDRAIHSPEKIGEVISTSSRPFRMTLKRPKERAEDRLRSRKVMEELLTLNMLAAESQNCPKCHVLITRSEGCNHMTCRKCGTHFCYRCCATLNPASPYDHFKSGACQTFDNIPRPLRNKEIGYEVATLKAQFGDQKYLFDTVGANLQARERSRIHVRGRQNGDAKCPTCGHFNARQGTLNHIGCPFCRTNYCRICNKRIHGVIPNHYRGQGTCPMNGEPRPPG